MEKFGKIWKNIEEKCRKFLEWIKRNKKTLLQLSPFLIALSVLICYIFQINTKVTFGVANTLCVALITVELILGIAEKSNKAKLGIFLSCLFVSVVMIGFNLNKLFSEDSNLTLQKFITELSLLSWLWMVLVLVSVLGVFSVLYNMKLKQGQELKQKNKYEQEPEHKMSEKQRPDKRDDGFYEDGDDMVEPRNTAEESGAGGTKGSMLNVPMLLIKMLPFF